MGSKADEVKDDELAAAWQDLSVRYHRIQCTLDRELQANHQLTSSEFEVLELLIRGEDGCVRMSDLADHVHLSQSATSRVVARLEADGLVTRSMCDKDRRSVFAALTDAGVRRYSEARPTQRRVLNEQSVGCQQLLVTAKL
ncbi:putative MarR family transcriptional regulator [Gordonia effusa NBRC 100432]|uniref:Putative MarR family transcriptional regulator n=1 Tax=Gordonia effusa NBRC 100432 TaxID=1077974 RepID=H0R3Q9_9ACTN|nr:MarR family transcriptional regulator [Gordonia effusa]GAB19710.1 putative MarR family transcriptional regulator [Gordonia effusa NBRC 100432]